MSDLAVSFTFSPNTTISSSEVNTNLSDIVNYINNRDDGTSTWDNVNVTSSAANPVTIKSSAVTTEVAIDNTATDGDSLLTFKIGGSQTHVIGVDDSDNDILKFGTTALTTNVAMQIPTTGVQVQFSVGSLTVPGVSFVGDTDIGMTRGGADNLSFVVPTGGSFNWYINSGQSLAFSATNGLQNLDGSVTAPSFTFLSDVDLGLYRVGSNHLGIVGPTGGQLSMYINSVQTFNWSATEFDPIGAATKTIDLGAATLAWDDAYADDFNNVADIPFFDSRKDLETGEVHSVDDITLIKSIKPKKDEQGNLLFDENGYSYWDDSSLPEWVFLKDKTKRLDIKRDSNGKPWISLKVLSGLTLGAIKALSLDVDKLKEKVGL